MSKKSDRVTRLIAIHNELARAGESIMGGRRSYSDERIENILAAIRCLLADDGISGVDPKSKVNG